MENTKAKNDDITRIEQAILSRLSGELSGEGIAVYEDRDEYGMIGFLVCRNSRVAVEILEDSPALWTHNGNSLIITVSHPDRQN